MLTIKYRRLHILIITLIVLGAGVIIIIYRLAPPRGADIYQKPAHIHSYYYIYAEEDGRELMRVPIAINVDDELITEDNKRYRVISVAGDKGIARYVEDVNLEQHKPK